MRPNIRKAVFPAAGLGTRFLPATKAMPKEMLPLVDTPLIQYGVEEAKASGVTSVVIVTGRGKTAIEDHFDVSFELEFILKDRGKRDLLEKVEQISALIEVSYVRQKEARGLGHAVLCARNLVGDEPFGVVLADDVIRSARPCLRQLVDVHEHLGESVLALMEVPAAAVSAYGIVDVDPAPERGFDGRLFRIRDMVEKPRREEAPSRLAIIGRYVLTPQVFASIAAVQPGELGEIQLTDGIKHLLASRPVYGLLFEGVRFDAGDKLGFLRATVEHALARPDLGQAFREYLRSLQL